MFPSFQKYISQILQQVSPNKKISTEGADSLNVIINLLIIEISKKAYSLTHPHFYKSKSDIKMTVNSREVQQAVRLIFNGELTKHAISEGTKAVTKFTSTKIGSPNERAHLIIPISKIKTIMREYCRFRISSTAPVYLAAVTEYLLAELLEISSRTPNETISVLDIKTSIMHDEELKKLFITLKIHLPGFEDLSTDISSLKVAENYLRV